MGHPRRVRRRGWIGLLLVLAGGCASPPAVEQGLARPVEPIRFGCTEPDAVAPAARTRLRAPRIAVRLAPDFPAYAGDIALAPDRVRVPFSADTPPAAVLQADLERRLAAGRPVAGPAPRERLASLDATLVRAFAERSLEDGLHGVVRARVVVDLRAVESGDPGRRWGRRVETEHAVRPDLVTPRAVEAALAGAYCRALDAIVRDVERGGAR